MKIVRNLFALLICLNLFTLYSCSVDELDDEPKKNATEKIVATGEDNTPPDPGGGSGGN